MTTSIRRWQVVTTSVLVVLSVVSALLGLFRPGHYNDAPALLPTYFAQDLMMLAVGVPVVALGLWFTVRGSLRGRIVWLGSLAYMTYMWASIGLQVAFNEFFLGYAALFSLSLFTFVGGVVTTDAEEVHDQLSGRVSGRVYGAFLVVIALGLAFLWLSEVVPATLTGTEPLLVAEVGPQAMISHFLDLTVVVPALVVSGIWLWRGRQWGYTLAGVSLVFGAVLAPTLTLATFLLFTEGEVTVSVLVIVFTVLPAAIAATLAIKFVLAVPRERRSRVGDEVGEAV
ncbi:hypothetical protein GJR96_08255 [Haloferax sp. MBLA0076]|uniref:Uncharacterized protein n=1 Tax=Haloferax litoreum TaxID=2666140 RepID=A0A6A8GII7_9EURY|nr:MULTISPECIES: hypothetical protein [Haloferax]KAB1193436.1 hypothetical protein Hfx1148_08250 [Haloferax sp. CBA1148]MRX21947.1 hypothetical protein [Haloferax litoreum]